MPWEDDEVPSLVQRVGPEEVGKLYAIRSRESLRALRAGLPSLYANVDDPLGWVEEAVGFRCDLDPEVRFRMVVAAINEAGDDEDLLWCMGDMPAEHLAAVPGMTRRFHQARSGSPSVERLFRVMQAYYRNVWQQSDAGWWDDDPTLDETG